MDYLTEIKTLIEQGNAGVANLKARLDALETFQAKSQRPNLGGTSRVDGLESNEEVKSFNRYLKTGDKAEIKAMSTGSGPDGGYAVPKVIDGMMETLLLPQSPIRQYASVQQISTPDFHKLVNTRGTAASWVGETEARPATATPQLVDVAPPMGEIYANLTASQQMLDDAYFNASTWLAQEAADAFAESESSKFLTGTGVNQPKGILTYTVASTADATRAFGTLQYIASGNGTGLLALNTSTGVGPLDALQQMIFSMHPGYRGGAAWFMNSLTLSTLCQLKDAQGRFLVMQSTQAGQPAMLLGYPVVECMHMADVGANAYPIMFANLSRGYLIADRIGTRVLVDPFSNKPNVGHYVTRRVGGAVQNSLAIKLLKIAAS